MATEENTHDLVKKKMGGCVSNGQAVQQTASAKSQGGTP